MSIKAPYLPREDIWEKAEELRERLGINTIPIDIMSIVEIDLGFDFITKANLRSEFDMEAILCKDTTTIIVDYDDFLANRLSNRFRFSLAHELGHQALHSELIKTIPDDLDDYFEFIKSIPKDEYGYIEWQANEFAGRFLVPLPELKLRYDKEIERVPSHMREADLTKEYVADQIAPDFSVSSTVIEKRIHYERL